MKRKIIGAAICAFLASAPFAAHAYDSTINFTGQVSANSCTVSTSSALTMPTMSTAALGTAGFTAGTTPVDISFSGCTVGVNTVTAFFEQGGNVDATTGNLLNTGTATGVEIGLYNLDGSAVALNAASGNQNVTPATVTDGSGAAHFVAKYVATSGTVTAGTLASTLYVTFVYA